MDSPEEEIQRRSKLKLCNCVNELYKLSDKNYSFFYLDLIEPSKKKTLHLLQNLLNYVLYYDMVKEEVVKKCEVSVKLLESLRMRKVNLETHIEEMKIKHENVRDQGESGTFLRVVLSIKNFFAAIAGGAQTQIRH